MRLFSDEAVQGFLADGWWTGDTWGDLFQRNVRRYPDHLCLVDAPNKPGYLGRQPRRLTWQDLGLAVDRCAEVLFQKGIRQGDVVGIQIPNSVELAITYLALIRLGAILSPYPIAYRRHEIDQLAVIAGIRAVVTITRFSGRDLTEDAAAVLAALGRAEMLFIWDESGSGSLDLDDMLRGPHGDPDYEAYLKTLRPDQNDCAIILFTSGTTGTPKGVPRAHGDSLVSASATVAAPGLTHSDVVLCPMPMVNGGSIAGMFLPWLLTGCRLVMHHPFDLELYAAQVEAEAVTYSVAPPTILNDIVADDRIFSRYDLSSLRILGSGSSPLSGWMIKRWETDHGVEIINFFGATEGVQLFADAGSVPDPALRGRCLPMPGSPRFQWRTEVGRRGLSRLVDVQTGQDIIEPGVPGELRVKGPNIFSGYLHEAKDTFDEQGYYCTGDIFERSPDVEDLLILVDRAKDMIIRGGMNISAPELESLLVAHPKVAEVAAVGRADDRLGERTCVFVVPRDHSDPPSLKDLVDYLNEERVATFKLPESMELVDRLPRNPAGKVLKAELRMRINGSDGRAVPEGRAAVAAAPSGE